MAPIDMQHLSSDQIYKGADDLTWLYYVRKKTNIAANVPLLKQAITLIEKYKNESDKQQRQTVFPFVCNKVLNEKLKMIGEICEFNEPLTFYMARYTFATTVTLSHGVPVTSIKGMLGHQKLESTLYYARTTDDVIGLDMRLLQQKLDKMV